MKNIFSSGGLYKSLNCPPPQLYLENGSKSHSRAAGETILEALIAIAVFTIIIGPASALYISSTRVIAINRNDLVAATLAEEGVEMVRGMRDTNFLKFSPKAAECWNTVPDYTDISTCELPANKIGAETDGNFVLQVNLADLTWSLVQTSDALDLADAETPSQDETFRLRLDSATNANPECGVGTPSEPAGCNFHRNIYFSANGGDPALAARGEETGFYRQISIKYWNLDDSPESPQPEAMSVTSLVQYRTGTQVRSIRRGVILANQPSLR